jgi:hypothetical protein
VEESGGRWGEPDARFWDGHDSLDGSKSAAES